MSALNLKFAAATILVFIMISGCKKDKQEAYQSTGHITGYDMRMCAMCGGYFITIDSNDTTSPPISYLISNDLPQLGFNNDTKFPVSVSLNWQPDTQRGGYPHIIVTKIKVN